MLNALNFVRAFFGERLRLDDRGVTAIEYGLIAALIAVVIIAALILVGQNLLAVFNYVAGQLTT